MDVDHKRNRWCMGFSLTILLLFLGAAIPVQGGRYYKPATGAFVQPDPYLPDVYDPQQLNRYGYGLNNPYRYTDPSGHYVESAIDVAFITYDLYEIDQDPSLVNYVAFGADVASLLVPVVAGGGLLVRGGSGGVKALQTADRASDLARTSQRVADSLGPASSAVEGTIKHAEAAKLLQGSGMKNVYTEVSVKGGLIAPYATKGSTRVDAIASAQDLSKIGTKIDPAQTTGVIDFKFGKSGLTSKQASSIQRQTGVQPLEIRPQTQKTSLWGSIKSFFSRKK